MPRRVAAILGSAACGAKLAPYARYAPRRVAAALGNAARGAKLAPYASPRSLLVMVAETARRRDQLCGERSLRSGAASCSCGSSCVSGTLGTTGISVFGSRPA